MNESLPTNDAFNPRSEWWGWMPSPVALVLHVCELCEADVMREFER